MRLTPSVKGILFLVAAVTVVLFGAMLLNTAFPPPQFDVATPENEAALSFPAPVARATPTYTLTSTLQQVRLVKAFDGDSGIAADANGEFEFRLYGINAPERDDVSQAALVRLVATFGNDLYAEERDVDGYGRRVVVLGTRDGSRSVNVEMVRQGYAYAYLDYGELEGIVAAEGQAQANGRGVWAPPATPTWDEYWIEQDRQGNFRKTFDDYLYSDPAYAWANPRVKEYMESLYEPLKAQFDILQGISLYVDPQAVAEILHFKGYLTSETHIWDKDTWEPLLQYTYELMSDSPPPGSADSKSQANLRQILNESGVSILKAALARSLNPIAGNSMARVLDQRYAQFKSVDPRRGQAEFFMQEYPSFADLIAGGRSTQPTAAPKPTPTPISIREPRSTPVSTATPTTLELWEQGYAAGYAVGASCGSPNPRTSGDPWKRGYQTGFNAGRQNECEPPPTSTPMPGPVLTAPREVWDCFLTRDDSRRDKNGTVLSPCGWREHDRRVYKWRSPVNVNVFTSTESAAEREKWLTQAALDELAPLLRLEFNMITDLPWSNDNAINLRFVDTSNVPCGEGTQFHGCAEGHRAWTDEIAIAAHAGDRGLSRILRHELLHLLAYMAHAHQGIMSTGEHWDGSYELTPMDRAQLWLYSNPLIKSGMSLDEIRRMARFGEWR